MAYIELKNNTKIYQSGDTQIYANKDITFSVAKGELVIILGSSGAGKSTLLNILGGMEPNTSGDVIVAGKNIAGYNAKELTTYRRNDIGQRKCGISCTNRTGCDGRRRSAKIRRFGRS